MAICMIFGAGERVPRDRIGRTGRDALTNTVWKQGQHPEYDTEGIGRDAADLVVAADGGMDWIREELPSLRVDIFIGDMDSLSENVGSGETTPDNAGFREAMWKNASFGETYAVPRQNENGTAVIKLPVEKDDTDMGAAVKIGLERGYKTFYLYGGTGGRWDHTIANLQLLKHIALCGGTGFLIGPRLTATVVHADGAGRTIIIQGNSVGRPFSLFAMGTAEGVTIRGAKYETDEVTLTDDHALGVSNETTEKCTAVSLRKGTLLVVGEYLPCDILFS